VVWPRVSDDDETFHVGVVFSHCTNVSVSMCSDQKVSQLVEKWELELEEQNKVCC